MPTGHLMEAFFPAEVPLPDSQLVLSRQTTTTTETLCFWGQCWIETKDGGLPSFCPCCRASSLPPMRWLTVGSSWTRISMLRKCAFIPSCPRVSPWKGTAFCQMFSLHQLRWSCDPPHLSFSWCAVLYTSNVFGHSPSLRPLLSGHSVWPFEDGSHCQCLLRVFASLSTEGIGELVLVFFWSLCLALIWGWCSTHLMTYTVSLPLFPLRMMLIIFLENDVNYSLSCRTYQSYHLLWAFLGCKFFFFFHSTSSLAHLWHFSFLNLEIYINLENFHFILFV